MGDPFNNRVCCRRFEGRRDSDRTAVAPHAGPNFAHQRYSYHAVAEKQQGALSAASRPSAGSIRPGGALSGISWTSADAGDAMRSVHCTTHSPTLPASRKGAPTAGSLKDSPLVSTAHAKRAFFAAMSRRDLVVASAALRPRYRGRRSGCARRIA